MYGKTMSRARDQIHDELLVLRAQAGDADALEELFDQWNARFVRHAWRLTGDAEAAKDVSQEAWMSVVTGLRSLDDPSRFRVWAYRIVTRRCADWIRRTQRQRSIMTEWSDSAPSGIDSTLGRTGDLASSIAGLPRDARTVIAMYYLDEMGISEIAASLGIPAGTVKSRLFNARESLRRSFKQETTREA